MDKDTILNYVTETPGNTNRAVLGSMLDSLSGGEEGVNTLKVTLSGNNAYSLYLDIINNGYIDNRICSFDGTTYEAPMYILDEGVYGIAPYLQDIKSQFTSFENRLSFSTTGAVNIVEDQDSETGYYRYTFIITGDCTITIN